MSTIRQHTHAAAPDDTAPRTLTRCAVCKVDLKGRFVYIDEHAQQLFGCSGEELFGKSVIDFVDEPSRSVINEVLSRRNHYEITFDHLDLTIVDPNNLTTHTGAIVTLNFNAGNPVNFQFIFNTETAVSVDPARDPHAGALRRLAAYLDGRDLTTDWRGYCRQLQSFTGARQVCAYIISPDRLEHRSSALDTGDGISSLPTISDPGPLHNQVAETGETYDFTDQQSIQRAVELGAAVSNEIIARLTFSDDRAFLLRVIFPHDLDDATAQIRADRTRFAVELTQRFAASPPRSPEDREAENIQFAIGLLDGLGIGALMVDSRGKVAVYNPALADLLKVDEVTVDVTELATILSAGDPDREQQIAAFLRPSGQPRLRNDLLRIELPIGRSGLLASLPLSGNTEDLTSFIAVVPGVRAADASDVLSFGRVAAQALGTQIADTSHLAGQLGQKCYNAVDKEGNAQLSRLNLSLQDLARLTHDLTAILAASGEQPRFELTDLNVLLHRIANHINRRHANEPLRVHTEVMPKISTSRRAVTLALEHLLYAIADVADRGTTAVKVAAEVTEPSLCTLTIVVDAALDRDHPTFAGGIQAARLLIRSIGGTVAGKSGNNQTSFSLTLPIEPGTAD